MNRAKLPVVSAARKLDPAPVDPVLAALLNAPLSDEPDTEERRAAFEVGMADIRAGRTRQIGPEEMKATLERMRRDQGE